jgi:hypothetical protein
MLASSGIPSIGVPFAFIPYGSCEKGTGILDNVFLLSWDISDENSEYINIFDLKDKNRFVFKIDLKLIFILLKHKIENIYLEIIFIIFISKIFL